MTERKPGILVLIGATATGKTEAAIAVARRLRAEVVSLDSMLLYRGMDIGTAKPADLGGIPHHLIDRLDPAERFDVNRYLAEADATIEDIAARGRVPLVVGGTGLYLMGLLKGVFEGAPRDDALREELSCVDSGELHARLALVDPETAARLHANDRRRITRALEVHATTGRPLSELQSQFDGPDRYPARIAGLRIEREELRRRVEGRVDAMLAAGLVAEVAGLELGPTASQAVGYKELLGHLAGEYDLPEARRLIVRNTMRLARRQATWFKRFDVAWFDADLADLPEQLVQFFGLGSVGATTE
ncbi:MAG: tRNA (adenosine(37)-N6)-dimethylallyltransferase MiaA [Planctomycetota bacterium]